MVYMGSKAKYAKYIVPILQKCIDENDVHMYIEPFVGGANIIDKISCTIRYGLDRSDTLIALLTLASTDFDKILKDGNRELWDKGKAYVKDGIMPDNMTKADIGAMEFFASFSNGGFPRGYAKNTTTRNYFNEAYRNMKQQAPNLKGIEFRCMNYYELDPQGIINSVIYCDPPYKNTKFYATPTAEVTNILETEGLDIYTVEGIKTHYTVLEPCVGGGHMLQGIIDYADKTGKHFDIVCRDIKNRGAMVNLSKNSKVIVSEMSYGQDFLADDYPTEKYDYVIMNPPFATIEPFCLRALELTRHKLIMFGRTKFIEGIARYNNIFAEVPPQRMYQYIERVACAKDGDFTQKLNSVEANAWYVWDLDDPNFGKNTTTELYWIHRK